jgi:DNA repair photolyase
MDTYAGCSFGCSYCSTAARGGAAGTSRGAIEGSSLPRRLDRLATAKPRSVVDEFLQRRQAIHLGGMSDPFPSQEADLGITLNALSVLAGHRYPTVISTKSTLFASPPYLDLLLQGNFLVQVSFSTMNQRLAGDIERGVPSPSHRLRAMETAASAGLAVAMRHQPVLPGHESDMLRFVRRASDIGARHYAAEFLKMGIEDSKRQRALQDRLPELQGSYTGVSSRLGREWLLPVERRLDPILQARAETHSLGMTFGAADTDLLPLSDGLACCSAADLHLPEHGSTFDHNYVAAVRSHRDGLVTYGSIRERWRPSHSMARFVNSRSRIASPAAGAGIEHYVRRNWDGRPNGPSPEMFHGVRPTGERSPDGAVVYTVDPWLGDLLRTRRTRPPVGEPGMASDGHLGCEETQVGMIADTTTVLEASG